MSRLIHSLVFVMAPPVWADIAPTAWVADTLKHTRAPGVAMGIIGGGEIRIAAGGLRAIDDAAAVTENDLWHAGSITKSMTATLIARLAEVGAVSWDDTVDQILGKAVKVDPAFADVSYGELLTHRAGLPANMPMLASRGLSGVLADRDMMADRVAYVQAVLSEPGKARGTFKYSNAGYVVAGAMLQQSTGQTWEALMQAHVFDPLGLHSAGFGPPGTINSVDQPRGHRGLILQAIPPGPSADNIPALGPAGTVHIGVADMLTYLRAHALQDTGFLSADSWARLHTPPADGDYAMGWVVTPQGWLAHDGSNTMWYATVGFVPDTDRAVFMAANFAGWGTVARAMAQGVIAALED